MSRFLLLFIRPGEVGKDPFDDQIGHSRDLLYFLNALFCIRETDPAHPGIHFHMDLHRLIGFYRFLRQLRGRVHTENRRPDALIQKHLIMFRKHIPQNQDWFRNPMISQNQGLLRGRHREPPHIVIPFHQTGDRYRSVTVTVRFHNCNHRRSR